MGEVDGVGEVTHHSSPGVGRGRPGRTWRIVCLGWEGGEDGEDRCEDGCEDG